MRLEILSDKVIASYRDNSMNCFAMINDSLSFSTSNNLLKLCYKSHDSNFGNISY